ncbi:hypothetical protein LB535_10225 [Mesorhizobium sp. CA10]|uniref:hypothetical protein n=1 Tax=Mesorhizobium sp. CA10 TaxID=588495 RepID=UPI001CCE16DB|nr:hypothetical protein [Mesorhizobium sp. CA10]MBZ9882729.1 hypothetical protein [Mesorhizobium sp. CA10]
MNQRTGILSARMWLLTLLDAAERIGIAPLSAQRLHRLVYLGNAMAPVYDLLTPDGYLLKYKRGPFFPEVQWDIDRVCAQGLAAISNLKTFNDDLGWWFEADYSLTEGGMAAVDKAIRLAEMSRRATFIREVVRAFASVLRDEEPPEAPDDVVLMDVTYKNADADGPIDFETASRNLTSLAADAIARRVSSNETAGRRETVHLYFRYLDRVWDLQQGRASA